MNKETKSTMPRHYGKRTVSGAGKHNTNQNELSDSSAKRHGWSRLIPLPMAIVVILVLARVFGLGEPLGSLGASFHALASLTMADSTPLIKRQYAYAGERRIHYRRAGQGPPLVMLHASAVSSFSLEPLIRRLAKDHTAIAIDTPGYGESAGLGLEQPEIADYAAALAETLTTLTLDRIDLYGTHTGAAIALEFALRHPQRVHRLVLDGVPIFTPEERADMLEHYTPSLAPQWDGSHLVRAWAMQRDMRIFWPWYKRSLEARRLADLPSPEALHATVVDFLRAGPHYWQAYHAAFRYDAQGALRRLSVPTLLVAMPGDPLRAHLQRIGDVAANVKMALVGHTGDPQRAFAEGILEFLAGDPLPNAPAPPPVVPAPGVVRRDYVDTSVGQLLVRRTAGGTGRPLVLFHASPTSSVGLEPLLLALGADRPVVTFDNPGNGDSAPVPGAPEMWDVARILGEAIDALGLKDYDVYGTHTGAHIAMELAIARPQQVRHLILDGITMFSDVEIRELLANYVQPLRISGDGGHLIWAWNFVRDGALWWPWYNRTAKGAYISGGFPSPEALQKNFVEFIKGGTTYDRNYRAALGYPTRTRLPLITTPTLLCTGPTDILRPGLAEASRLAPHVQVRISAGLGSPEAKAATVELYRRFLADQPLPGGSLQDGKVTVRRRIVDTRFGQVHVRMTAGGGPPLLLLHMTPLSGGMFETLMNEMGNERMLIAIDRLGFGASDPPPRQLTMDEYAQATLDVLDALECKTVDVLGIHTGAVEAVALALAVPVRIRRVGIVSVPVFTNEEVKELRARLAAPPPPPSEDGAQLLALWRKRFLYRQPPYDLPLLHSRLIDELVAGPNVRLAYEAVFTYPLASKLPALTRPLIVFAPHDDLIKQTERSRPLLPANTTYVDLPDLHFDIFHYGAKKMADLVRLHFSIE